MITDNMTLLVTAAFLVKHDIADFYLQTPYMLGKGKSGSAWVLPLSAHCLVHAAFTLGILLLYKPTFAIQLSALEFAIHFIVDRIKATYKAGPDGQWNFPEKGKYLSNYYRALGNDQLAHGLTYILLIFICINF